MTTKLMGFGQKLRMIRLFSGLTCQQLADKCDSSKQYICAVENGKCRPSERLLRAICAVYEISFDKIDQINIEITGL